MEPYIVLLIILFLLSQLKKVKPYFFWSVFVAIWMFTGLRSFEVGTDTMNIYKFFQAIDSSFALFHQGPGWLALAKFTEYCLNNEYRYLLLLTDFIIWFPIFLRIRLSYFKRKPFLPVFFYVLLGYMFNMMNVSRQMMAVSIIFFFFKYVEEKKYKLFYLGMAVAVIIHPISLICSIIPLYQKIRFKRKWLSLIFISFAFGIIGYKLIFAIPFLYRFSEYFVIDRELFSVTRLLLNFLYFALLYCTYNRYRNNFHLKNMFVGIIMLNLAAFSGVTSRLSIYFLISQILVFSASAIFSKKTCKFYKWLKLSVYVYGIIYFSTMLVGNIGGMVPYIFIE